MLYMHACMCVCMHASFPAAQGKRYAGAYVYLCVGLYV